MSFPRITALGGHPDGTLTIAVAHVNGHTEMLRSIGTLDGEWQLVGNGVLPTVVRRLAVSASGTRWVLTDDGVWTDRPGRWWRLPFESEPLHGLCCVGEDVWVVGEAGHRTHFAVGDNKVHRSLDGFTGTLRAVMAGEDGIPWCVGDAGAVFRWDGYGWKRVPCDTDADLLAAAGKKVVFAVGERGTVRRWVKGEPSTHDGDPTLRFEAVATGTGFSPLLAAGPRGLWVLLKAGVLPVLSDLDATCVVIVNDRAWIAAGMELLQLDPQGAVNSRLLQAPDPPPTAAPT